MHANVVTLRFGSNGGAGAGTSGASTVLTQGYLLKRSSNMRADWKRRFFVLDALGHLTYYRDKARSLRDFYITSGLQPRLALKWGLNTAT